MEGEEMVTKANENDCASWPSSLLVKLRKATVGDRFWDRYFHDTVEESKRISIHLGVFVEPYLQFILDGKKTIESRFSSNKCAPYRMVQKGDIILLKRSGGPIVGSCEVLAAWFYQLDPESWKEIKSEFAEALCVQDPIFWEERQTAYYATLMRLGGIRSIEPIEVEKRDRRGWVVLQGTSDQLKLFN